MTTLLSPSRLLYDLVDAAFAAVVQADTSQLIIVSSMSSACRACGLRLSIWRQMCKPFTREGVREAWKEQVSERGFLSNGQQQRKSERRKGFDGHSMWRERLPLNSHLASLLPTLCLHRLLNESVCKEGAFSLSLKRCSAAAAADAMQEKGKGLGAQVLPSVLSCLVFHTRFFSFLYSSRLLPPFLFFPFHSKRSPATHTVCGRKPHGLTEPRLFAHLFKCVSCSFLI